MKRLLQSHKKMMSGRSMVEMLGVLVIIGVLSIGAIAGYSYAMNKYKADATINELTIRALETSKQMARGIKLIEMDMNTQTDLGYDVDAWVSEMNPNYFYIGLSRVPRGICKQILKSRWKTPIDIYVGTEVFAGNVSICGDDTYAPPMDFEFYRDFEKSSDFDGDIVDEPLTTSGVWFETAPSTQCTDDKPLASYNTCYACDISYAVMVGVNGKCAEVCPGRVKTKSGYCTKSCDASKPLMDIWGNCQSCDYEYNVQMENLNQCTSLCPEREIKGNNCVIPCGKGANKDKPLVDSSGVCYSCDTQSNVWVDAGGKCAEICPNRSLKDSYNCALSKVCGQGENANKPLTDTSGTCYACDYSYGLYVGERGKCEAVCPDREMFNNNCYLKCGVGVNANKPLMNTSHTCYDCATTTKVYVGKNGRCSEICNNRVKDSTGNYCILK